jgi:hypothetical protein
MGDLAVERWRRKRLAGLPMEDDGPTSGSADAIEIVFPRPAVRPTDLWYSYVDHLRTDTPVQ